MLIRFRGDMIAVDPASEANSTAQNERRALLCYTGKFDSMDGEVEITPDHLKRLVENHNARLKALGSQVKITDYPPVQLDHSTSAEHTVGRLVGPLELGTHDGQVAMFGHLRILGSDNLERVNDGRWSNLSIGADLDSGELQEISITPFPAARKACLLSAKFGGKSMNPLCKYLMDTEKIDQEEAMKRLEDMDDEGKEALKKKMQKRLSEEEDAEKAKLAAEEEEKAKLAAEEEEKAKLAAEEEEKAKLAAEEEEKAKLAAEEEEKNRLSADNDDDDKEEMKKHLSKASSRLKSFSLSLRKAKIGNTLARLKSEGRICPAEVKKIDIAKLAASTPETVDAVLATYEAREPIVHMGQYGTLKGLSAEDMANQIKMTELEAETRANMASLPKQDGATKKSAPARMSSPTREMDQDDQMVDTEGMFPEMVKAIKAGDEKAARLMFGKALRSYRGDTAVSNDEMTQLMGAFAELESDFGNVVRLAGVRLGVKL